jgi:hypothetical protein
MTRDTIAPALADLVFDLDDLQPHPRNTRRGDVDAIAESLMTFGQVRPIVVQSSTSYVVAGNHLLRAAREIGWKQVAAVRVELDDDEALRYLLADNRIPELGGYDERAHAALLDELLRAGRLQGTGYSPDDVDDLRAAAESIDEELGDDVGGALFESPEETAARRPPGEDFEPMREVIVLLEVDRYEIFANDLRRLKAAWGIETARDVIVEAVGRAAAADLRPEVAS